MCIVNVRGAIFVCAQIWGIYCVYVVCMVCVYMWHGICVVFVYVYIYACEVMCALVYVWYMCMVFCECVCRGVVCACALLFWVCFFLTTIDPMIK